jgi:hypothetical protein
MNPALVEQIADAVLYEGYMLYPYAASSLKNRQRFNFGILYPPGYDSSEMITECLALDTNPESLDVRVRFLECTSDTETVERQITNSEPHFDSGKLRARIEVAQTTLCAVDRPSLERISVRICNETSCTPASRDEALLHSMISTHVILTSGRGEFLSLTDPPREFAQAAAACRNAGWWPVLVGNEGERDTILAAPIILPDYPQIAPESPGDLFDGTEIDEILTLRILTLSEEEKAEIRAGPKRGRSILERSESLPPEQLRKLHGALRGLRQERP